jgi:hypothetical protein
MNLLETTILIAIAAIGIVGLVAAVRTLPRLLAWLRAAPPVSAAPTALAERPAVSTPVNAVTPADTNLATPDHLPLNSGPDPSGPVSGRRA